MYRAYKRILTEAVGQEVVIHRADATELKGKVAEINEDGCVIYQDHPALDQKAKDNGGVLKVFVDYSHIRGVGEFGWDLSNQ